MIVTLIVKKVLRNFSWKSDCRRSQRWAPPFAALSIVSTRWVSWRIARVSGYMWTPLMQVNYLGKAIFLWRIRNDELLNRRFEVKRELIHLLDYRIRFYLSGISILNERHRDGRFVQLQPSQMDAGQLWLLGHVAQGSHIRHKRLQRRSSVPEARYAGISTGLQGNVCRKAFYVVFATRVFSSFDC